jgi:hypothetical protein
MAVQEAVHPAAGEALRLNSLKTLQKTIVQTPNIASKNAYWQLAQSLHGPTVTKPAPNTASQLVQLGDSPNGFGKGVIWSRATDAILLVVFLNAADPLGISVSNVESTDTVTVISATGIASFSKDKGNPILSSIIGILGEGIADLAKLTGIGAAAAPLINDATQFAQNQFKGTNAATDYRDAFGVEPKSGSVERQEGGVLVTLPGAGGPYYSGDSDHKNRWIKPGGSRDDAHRPPHVIYGFYPVQNAHNARPAGANGDVFLTPWDFAFDDNAGFYKIELAISKKPLT